MKPNQITELFKMPYYSELNLRYF